MTEEEEKMKPPYINVIELETRKVIGRVKLNDANERRAERVMMGMMRNLRDGLVLEEVLE